MAGSTSTIAPMKYSLLVATVLLACIAGCGPKVETIRQGTKDADKHAKDIEKAGEPDNPANPPESDIGRFLKEVDEHSAKKIGEKPILPKP